MVDILLENRFTSTISSIFSAVLNVFENYGWYLLIILIVVTYIYQNKLKAALENYQKAKDEAEYAAKYHKNPDLLSARLTAQQTNTEKLQEKYRRDAEEYLKKMEEKEARKREELLDKIGGQGGRKLGTGHEEERTANKTTKSLKPDYNPLMGGGSSYTYRAPRRSPCGGGGCG